MCPIWYLYDREYLFSWWFLAVFRGAAPCNDECRVFGKSKMGNQKFTVSKIEGTSRTSAIGVTSETFTGAISRIWERRAMEGSPGFWIGTVSVKCAIDCEVMPVYRAISALVAVNGSLSKTKAARFLEIACAARRSQFGGPERRRNR